jgi:hypothetical protein
VVSCLQSRKVGDIKCCQRRYLDYLVSFFLSMLISCLYVL